MHSKSKKNNTLTEIRMVGFPLKTPLFANPKWIISNTYWCKREGNLCHPCEKGKLIRIFSSKPTDPQREFTTTEKEALAILKGIENFHPLIYGSIVDIFIDNKNICYDCPLLKSKLQRWKFGRMWNKGRVYSAHGSRRPG